MGPQDTNVVPIKVVVDTNVLISAFLWQATVKEIFLLAKKGKIAICVSEEIIAEFERVLAYPKFEQLLKRLHKTPATIINEFMEVALQYPSYHFHSVQIQEDPSDDKFLACGLTAQAAYIISGDHHLTDLKAFRTLNYEMP